MEKFKFFVLSIIVLAILVLLGFWAVTSLPSGSEYRTDEIISKLEDENEDLKQQIEDLTKELEVYKPVEVKDPVTEPIEDTTTLKIYKNQAIINELEQLIVDKVQMKFKSVGTRVGTIQKFLNVYNNTNLRIDNAYGEGTKKSVIIFQKAEGLTANGEVDETTFTKMIEWLKEQG